MAIVVENEQQSSGGGVVSFMVWLFILGAIAAAVYYIFFARPDLIPATGQADFERTQQVSNLSIDPEAVVTDPRFSQLRQYITLPQAGAFGRTNPFLRY